VPATIAACEAAVEKERVDLEAMRRWLWLIPFGFLRRFILRWLMVEGLEGAPPLTRS
jgi:hypothetical protein